MGEPPSSNDDILHVDQLVQRCMGSIRLVERLLKMYATQLEDDIEGLRRAIDEGAVDRLTSTAHRIKGSAANIEAHATHRVAAEIERRARAGETSELLDLIELLGACHVQVREQFVRGDLWKHGCGESAAFGGQ